MNKRTYKDRAEYLIKAVAKRRKKIKEMAIAYKGGKCNICGYNKCNTALDFHHKDEKNKRFGLSVRGLTRSWDKTKDELDKCILVCANCHREIHEGITQLPVETPVEKSWDNGEG
jgi:predicted HNH restriction endonuclease